MKTKLTLALAAILTSSAFAAMPAKLPEFMNSDQLAKWRAETDAKNAAKAESAPSASDVPAAFYTGKPYIESTGTYAFKYRSYNPELARWTSEDPSGFPDGANNTIYGNCPNSGVDSNGLAWSDIDFVKHFYEGNGATVYLWDTGLLDRVREASWDNPTGGAFKFDLQIEQTIHEVIKPYNGAVYDSFENSYSFNSVLYSLGSATLSGAFAANMVSTPYTDGRSGGFYSYQGLGGIRFEDEFTDPTSVIEYLYGSSSGGPSWLRDLTNIGGTPFRITGKFDMYFNGSIIKSGSGTYE